MDGISRCFRQLRIAASIALLLWAQAIVPAQGAAGGIDPAEARLAVARTAALLAEMAKDMHQPRAAGWLAEAGLGLLNTSAAEPPRHARRLLARLFSVRAYAIKHGQPAEGIAQVEHDLRCVLELAGSPTASQEPAPHKPDWALRRLLASAELGLAGIEQAPHTAAARCRKVLSLLDLEGEGSGSLPAAPVDLWMIAAAHQSLGELYAGELSDPAAAVREYWRALPLWHRLRNAHPLGMARIAQWHVSLAALRLSSDDRSAAQRHLDAAVAVAQQSRSNAELLLCRARAEAMLAQLLADTPMKHDEAARQLQQAISFYAQLPSAATPLLEEAALHRRLAELHFMRGELAQGKGFIEQAIDVLRSVQHGKSPDAKRARLELASCYLSQGDALEAANELAAGNSAFLAAQELFPYDALALDAAKQSQPWPAGAQVRMRLICDTRLAGHLARRDHGEKAVLLLESNIAAVRRAAIENTAELSLPMARAYHLLGALRAGRDGSDRSAQQAYESAIAHYRLALRESTGDRADLGICYLDLSRAVDATTGDTGKVRELLEKGVTALRETAEEQPVCWLPLSTGYAEKAQLGDVQAAAGWYDRAVEAAGRAIAAGQGGAQEQLVDLLLQRAMLAMDTDPLNGEEGALRDLNEAAAIAGSLRRAGSADEELAWSELAVRRMLAKLLWQRGATPEQVCDHWRAARRVLETVRAETAAWHVAAARLEALRAEMVAWTSAAGVDDGVSTLVPTTTALRGDEAPGAIPPTAAAAAQAFQNAAMHYRTAAQQGGETAEEQDVLLFNAADFCESYLGDARAALRFFEEELAIQEALHVAAPVRAANRGLILARMGLIESRLLGRPDRAADLYRDAAAELRVPTTGATDGKVPAGVEIVVQGHLALGLLSAQLPGLDHAAQEYFAEVLRLAGSVAEAGTHARAYEYWAHQGLAQEFRRRGSAAQAEQHRRRAEELAVELGFDQSPTQTGSLKKDGTAGSLQRTDRN